MARSPTLIQALASALKEASRVNGSVQSRPAAVLWTDAARQWVPAMALLRGELPGVLGRGAYEPTPGRGPAIWLKCAVAGLIPEVTSDQAAFVLHLPGSKRFQHRPFIWHLLDGLKGGFAALVNYHQLVRLNIRPFMTAELLRHNKKPKRNITWDKDRSKDVESAPQSKVFKGERINDYHLTLLENRAARSCP